MLTKRSAWQAILAALTSTYQSLGCAIMSIAIQEISPMELAKGASKLVLEVWSWTKILKCARNVQSTQPRIAVDNAMRPNTS